MSWMLSPERNFFWFVMLSASAFSKYPRRLSYDCIATMFAPLARSRWSSETCRWCVRV